MGSWFLAKKQDGQQTQPMNALRVQSAVQGKAIPLLWGRNRIAANLIWYGDFTAHPVQQTQSGGKGGSPSGGGGKGQQGSVDYTYSVAVALGICQGPITDTRTCWNSKSIGTTSGFGFSTFLGTDVQIAWGYLTSLHPSEALNYRGLAYVAQAGIDLGSSTELQNYSFEVTGGIANAAPGIPDANPRDVIVDFLTNPLYGVPGWPADRLASLDQYAEYCLAAGLLVSPVQTEQREATAFLTELLAATNSSARWSSGLLDIVPWGDQPITGNGVTYTPDVAPLYDLTNDDFLPGADGGQPIRTVRRAPSERLNVIKIEFLDRTDNYDPDVVDDKDQASILTYGLRPSDVRQYHFFCLEEAARLSAHLQLGREQIPNTYAFKLPASFILIDVEDIVTLTRPEMVMYRQAVRITEITENADGSLEYVAEEFMGTAGAPVYGTQATAGYTPNTNADPGNVNEPIIFEPTDQLGSTVAPNGGGLQVWAAVSGVNTALWGGCNVYASYDGVNYEYLDRVVGPARMGRLTDVLPVIAANPTGMTIDEVNTLKVDLSESASALLSGTAQDVLALNTACYVGGEIVAYRDALLTGVSQYSLTYLVRGAYGTEATMAATPHPIGTPFARLDMGILKIPYDQSRIGSTVYLKFQSFNVWGGGLQDISALAAYPYVLTGSALASPLPVVQNLRLVYSDGFNRLWWDDVVDFRNGIRYKVFRGDTFTGAEQVDDVAHAPFNAFGAGTYWVVAYCQPVPNLYVQSEDPATISVQGAMLVKNLVYYSDQQAEGWPGIFSNGCAKDGIDPNAFIRLGGSANFLDDPDVLANPDILNAGGIVSSGTYEIGPQDYVDVKYVADCSVNITWKGVGIPVGQNILAIDDILNAPDILGSASTQYVNVRAQVATAQSADTDFFSPSDFFDPADRDVFTSSIEWSDWQDYAPGVYRARLLKFRLLLSTVDGNTIPYDLVFKYEVSVPPRIDHYPNLIIPDTGTTITFEPDDAASAAPFNGGPPVGGTYNQPLPIVQFQALNAAGLTPIIDSLTLASLTFHWEDAAGTHIAVPNCTVIVEGF